MTPSAIETIPQTESTSQVDAQFKAGQVAALVGALAYLESYRKVYKLISANHTADDALSDLVGEFTLRIKEIANE